MSELTSHHVGIVVENLDRAVSFYRDILGFEIVDEFTLRDGIGNAIDVEGVTGEFVHLDAGGTRIELIEYDPSGEKINSDTINQVGAKHVGFEVDDIEEFYANLPESIEPISGPEEISIGIDILFFRDPDGNFVEVVG